MTSFWKSPEGVAITVVGIVLAYRIFVATAGALKGQVRFRFSSEGPYKPASYVEGQVLIRARVPTPAERIVLRLFCYEGNLNLNFSSGSRLWETFSVDRNAASIALIAHDQTFSRPELRGEDARGAPPLACERS